MLHFNITEDNADVQDITERDRGGFEESSLVLVQANGLRIENNAVEEEENRSKKPLKFLLYWIVVKKCS